MRPWLVCWEQVLNRDLFLPAERKNYFAEFLVDGLLRGDIKNRYDAYAVGRQNGWLSADDIRELVDMNPLPDGQGKIYLVNGNMIPANQAGKHQAAEPDPLSATARSLKKERDLPEVRAANLRRGIADSYKRIFAEAVSRVLKREEADVMTKARQILVTRNMEQFNAWLSDFYRENEEYIHRFMAPAFVAYAEAVQVAAADEVGGQTGLTPELQKFVDDYLKNYIWRHAGSSIIDLREVLEKAIAEGRDQLKAPQSIS